VALGLTDSAILGTFANFFFARHSSSPKGCYCIGLPSGKSLFQLQAERLLRLRQLAATASGRPLEQVSLPWYIMTSEFTDAETRQFFERHQFFGLGERNVVFFQQGTMPCVDLQGKLLLETSGKVRRLRSFSHSRFTWFRGWGVRCPRDHRVSLSISLSLSLGIPISLASAVLKRQAL
jgi:hypothetical protein